MKTKMKTFACMGLIASALFFQSLSAQPSLVSDLSGAWYWEGRPLSGNYDKAFQNGRMFILLRQKGETIDGDLLQVNSNRLNYSETIFEIPKPGEKMVFDSRVSGNVYFDSIGVSNRIVVIKRAVIVGGKLAVFAGNLSPDGKTIEGYFTNTWGEGGRGWFVMKRIENGSANSEVSAEPPLNSGETDRRAILNLATLYEKAIENRSQKDLLDVYYSPETPVFSSKQPTKIDTTTAIAFVKKVLGTKDSGETIDQAVIQVRKDFASMHAHYVYRIKGVVKGSGEMVWLLARSEQGWKVIHHTWQDVKP